MMKYLWCPLLLPMLSCVTAAAPVPVAGSLIHSENFNSLGTGSQAWSSALLPGWTAQINNGSTATGNIQASNGTAVLSGLLNLGAAGAADRALGSRATSTGNLANIAVGIQFQNTGTAPLKIARITYTGELWRSNSTSTGQAESWSLFYAFSNTPLPALFSGTSSATAAAGSGFTAFPAAAQWSSPNNLPADASRDGNAAANRSTVSFVPVDMHLYPGEHLTLKWTDTNAPGNDGQQGLDDVSVEFVSMAGQAGIMDEEFNPTINSSVQAVAPLPDGRILAGGPFRLVNGVAQDYCAVLYPDSTLDLSFNPLLDSSVESIATQRDGSFLMAGGFTSVSNTPRRSPARFFPDGNLDTGYVSPITIWNSPVMQEAPDGRLLAGGFFGLSNGLRRLNTNGTLDAGFVANVPAYVYSMVIQPDGKVLIGGTFTTVNGQPRSYLARLLPDGTTDAGFNHAVANAVHCIALQPDGKILIMGPFENVGGVPRNGFARLHSDGSLDAGFAPGAISGEGSMVLQADGKILFPSPGAPGAAGSRRLVTRLHSDGTLDPSFHMLDPFGFGGEPRALMIQKNGSVLAYGGISSLRGIRHSGIALLLNEPAVESLAAVNFGRLQWLRSGTSPEVHSTTFDVSTDNRNTWTPLGVGTRVSGGWELTGLNLPTAGHLRARGLVIGGSQNSDSGLVETTVFYQWSALEQWRLTHFGTAENSGIAGNHADSDADGLENLVEYAFGLNPSVADAALLPGWEANPLRLEFTPPAAVQGVSYHAEYSSSLQSASWTALANTGALPAYRFVAPENSPRLFFRLRITAP